MKSPDHRRKYVREVVIWRLKTSTGQETVYVQAKTILTIAIVLVAVKAGCDSLTNEWYYTHTGKCCSGEGGCALFKHIIPAFAWNE